MLVVLQVQEVNIDKQLNFYYIYFPKLIYHLKSDALNIFVAFMVPFQVTC